MLRRPYFAAWRRTMLSRRPRQADLLDGYAASQHWLEASQLYDQLDRAEDALRCAQHAASYGPDDFWIRYWLALRLLDQGETSAAVVHLRWCCRTNPKHTTAAEKLRETLTEMYAARGGAGVVRR